MLVVSKIQLDSVSKTTGAIVSSIFSYSKMDPDAAANRLNAVNSTLIIQVLVLFSSLSRKLKECNGRLSQIKLDFLNKAVDFLYNNLN
jgi:hypothetical protein